MDEILTYKLQRKALEIRIGIMEQLKSLGFGHAGGSMSAADLLAVLYGEVMHYDPKNPEMPDRDQFVCSKGHAGPAVYAALALAGFFPYEELKTLNVPGTKLPSHCDRLKTPGIDMTTGSLGQGTSLAVGIAFAKKIKETNERVFLLVGDGESNEGQVWEAAMFAAAHKLDNLYWFVDVNKRQLDGYTKDILDSGSFEEKMKAFGFDVACVNGNDPAAIYEAIQEAGQFQGKPHAIILDTIKGAGLPELEQIQANHYVAQSAEKWAAWQKKLQDQLAALDQERGVKS